MTFKRILLLYSITVMERDTTAAIFQFVRPSPSGRTGRLLWAEMNPIRRVKRQRFRPNGCQPHAGKVQAQAGRGGCTLHWAAAPLDLRPGQSPVRPMPKTVAAGRVNTDSRFSSAYLIVIPYTFSFSTFVKSCTFKNEVKVWRLILQKLVQLKTLKH